MATSTYSMRSVGGEPTGAINWTGHTQAIAFTDTAGSTAITIPGHDWLLVASQDVHVKFGTLRMKDATAVDFFLPAKTYLPVYVSAVFGWNEADNRATTPPGTIYVNLVRNSANGTLWLTEMLGDEDCRGEGATSTTSSTTTTTTTTTSTSTSTTSTTT